MATLPCQSRSGRSGAFTLMSSETLAQLRAGALNGTSRLDLSADLTTAPPEILALAGSLEILNLSNNLLTDLPDWLPELKKLRILFCSNNPFQHVPEILGRCPALEMIGFKSCQIETVSAAALPAALRWLILTDNRLAELPAELGGCLRLQKLMLSGNRLAGLPPELAQCRNLELLRLAANQFEAFPEWLWDLPSLAWLAVAGNPCTQIPASPEKMIQEIPWSELTMGPLLGEGASGLIHQAAWTPDTGQLPCEVAVKLFKGAMTSDGLPASEMAACLAVGGHPQCVGAIGRIAIHPGNDEGLVMPLLDSSYRPLAGPPSLESCTRDTYSTDCRFSAYQALSLMSNITTAAAHVNSLGFLHGDLYAHNVLHSPDGGAFLSDFGAASSYPPGDTAKIERIEVRALGILMQEIVDHCVDHTRLPAILFALPALCMQPDASIRPGFREIAVMLQDAVGQSSS